MKYLFLFLIVACGKVEHRISGRVTVPQQYEVKHIFVADEAVFRESCENKFEEILDDEERHDKIDKCIENKQNTVSKLIDALNKE